jgi:hypothetical protein
MKFNKSVRFGFLQFVHSLERFLFYLYNFSNIRVSSNIVSLTERFSRVEQRMLRRNDRKGKRIMESMSSTGSREIPQPMDIILGRGKRYVKHPGNVIFKGTT